MKIPVINLKGEKVEEIEAPDSLAQVAGNEGIIEEVVRQHHAASRRGTASTKTRSQVVASGKKPWRQKGTGRARAGRRNSPIWRGGGVIFGPRPRDFSFILPKKVKRKALKSALAIRFQKGQVVVLDKLSLEEPKTKILVQILRDAGIGENVLILTPERNRELHLASRNLPQVENMGIKELNTFSVLSHPRLLVTREAFDHLQNWLEKIK